ncbi:MAG: ABC transporter permease [Clostridiales Family XIII bacterium]|nr:ABC transporter permease [Clostridiales Family XIII bacterium]
MTRKKLDAGIMTSLVLLVAILVFFTIRTKGNMISVFNLTTIMDQALIVIIAGLGSIFVVSLGGADLSVGTTLGISTVVGAALADATGNEVVLFPVAITVALTIGFSNGFLVAKLKVPSFMVTLAHLIGMRGVMLYVQSVSSGFYRAQSLLLTLKNDAFKIPILIILIIVMHFILSHTKFGTYCKAIGENESVALNVGVPVAKVKIIAFMLSSFMASVAGFFMMAKVGGTNNTMGINLEIDVLMGIFLGGVLVTGGYSASVVKLLIGSFTISVIKNGMVLAKWSAIEITEVTQGVLLILILFVMILLKQRSGATARPDTLPKDPTV